jgi:hypothetical protein
MAWLLREGDVLAAIEERQKGWQTSLSGAVVITGVAFVHTLTPSSAADLDLAWCRPVSLGDERSGYAVKRISVLSARRVLFPRVLSGALVAAPGGSFERWRLQVGDRLEVRGA